MCTLTFVPKGETDFILTSNRDEAFLRKTVPPQEYIENNRKVIYPKDALAGGTWLGLSDRKRVVCLLNGGFEMHQRQSQYRMSRGIIVKEVLTVEDVKTYIDTFDFTDIEPFTLVVVQWQEHIEIIELVWDGHKKHIQLLPTSPQIWSSSSLYTQAMKKQRHQWFYEFIEAQPPTSERLWEFHHTAGIGDKNIDLQIDRGFLKTVSTTQIIKYNDTTSFNYEDLQSKKIYKQEL